MFDLIHPKRRLGKEMVTLRDEMDNLFNRFFQMDYPLSGKAFSDMNWAPHVDISEGAGKITVKAEIPGCEAKDIDVQLNGRILTVSGEKKQERKKEDENFHRLERTYGSFYRVMELPGEVNQDDINATYSNGVLELVFTKLKETDIKKIQVTAA